MSKHVHRRAAVHLRLERWQRYGVYATCGWLTLTGLLWIAAHFFWRVPGEFGETISPWEARAMQLHGIGAMLILFLAGGLLNMHIRRALKTDRNRTSGWGMIALLLALAFSGYGLYYLTNEVTRPAWSTVHWVIGVGFPLLLFVHVVLGRKSRQHG
ncbi:DUF4405 domain-containing protein [Noviherbaspirillum galbum]|uniref:DUF4405 domain-containing protein n=1 Tax=Noviherbaspirillum galbum TaxID=2709383 RepID=A0A6B3SPX9_9BURK|nr:DUF4405 domain-containing protein [Noviherbaspirillum galbum]NEX62813.1 DUF4405 domain-containing protein [Noviherbaspirillum galbum]